MTESDNLPSRQASEIDVNDLARVVKGLSRLVTALSAQDLFKANDVGLSGWLLLTTLDQKAEMNSARLARDLGLSRERTKDICTALLGQNLIAERNSSQKKRSKHIAITDTGKAKVAAINTQLKQLLSEALKGRENAARGAAKYLKHLMKIGRVGESADKEAG